MIRWFFLALATALLLAPPPCRAADALDWSGVTFATEDLQPLGYVDKSDHRLKGATAEHVQRAMHRLGIPPRIEVVPWARALKILDTEKAFVFNLARTPQREYAYKWVYKTAEKRIGLFAIRGNHAAHPLDEELRQERIVVLAGSIAEIELKGRAYPHLYSLPEENMIIRFLFAGRADLWARTYLEEHDADEKLREAGQRPDTLERMADLDTRVELYLAANPAVPDALVEAMRNAMQATDLGR